MDHHFNSFFNNTNPNLQQNQYPLQPFPPTPNPRSRFPQNLNPAPGLNPMSSDSFMINIHPPETQQVPLLNFPGGGNENFHTAHPHGMNMQSHVTSMPTQALNTQTLHPTMRYTSPGSGQKIQLRKKGFSVGTNENQHRFGPGMHGLGYYPEEYYRRGFGMPQPERGLLPTQLANGMDIVQKPGNLKKIFMEENEKYDIDDILVTIEDQQINTVSMLNEVSSKIKKKVEYIMTETQSGKNRVFECQCLMEKAKIGTGKGSSKQAAKTEAAKAAICYLVTQEAYAAEGQAIMMSIQRSSQNGSHSPSVTSRTNLRLDRSSGTIPSDTGDVSPRGSIDGDREIASTPQSSAAYGPSHMNDSPLYELNVIAKECFIEPKWTLSPQPNQNGEFEVELRFEKLIAYGKGKKKQDAKRDAAVKIIHQIRSNQELSDRFNPKSKKQSMKSHQSMDPGPSDKDRRFFEDCVRYNVFDEIQKKPALLRDELKKTTQDFESSLSSLGQQSRLDGRIADHFRDLYKKIVDYTSMVTSSTKQVLIHAEKHIADFINNCHLVPIGSFALGNIRNENLTADCAIIFKEVKESEDRERLELYKEALEECQKLEIQSGAYMAHFKCTFALKTNHIGNYLEISNIVDGKTLKMNIYMSDLTQQSSPSRGSPAIENLESRICHAKQIYENFEDLEERLDDFRTLMTALRIWRNANDLTFLCPEILDIILLGEFGSYKSLELNPIATNCLRILSSQDLIDLTLLKTESFYQELFNGITEQSKSKICVAAKETLTNIYQGNLSSTKLF